MWDLFNLRRRSRRRAERNNSASTNTATTFSEPEQPTSNTAGLSGFFRRAGETSHPFFIPTRPLWAEPKCLGRLPCSQILYGARVEDFSSECWLEDHLHRFGSPENRQNSDPFLGVLDHSDDSVTASNDSTTSELFDFLNDELDTEYVTENEDNSIQPNESSTDIDTAFNIVNINITDPPPYIEFDMPPSYEEAVGNTDRRSTSSRSTSSSLAFMW